MRRMMSTLAALVLLAVGAPAGAQVQPASSADPEAVVRETELDRQTKEVAAQLRCVVCQGLSIQDSPSSLAQEMRALVREQLELGKSPDEVKEYFVEKYGEWVLLQPKARGFNLLVYVMPVLILLGGGVFVYTRARKWTSRTESDQPAEEEVEATQY
jgi:cytochrome c-type biogenesis protein CcmH